MEYFIIYCKWNKDENVPHQWKETIYIVFTLNIFYYNIIIVSTIIIRKRKESFDLNWKSKTFLSFINMLVQIRAQVGLAQCEVVCPIGPQGPTGIDVSTACRKYTLYCNNMLMLFINNEYILFSPERALLANLFISFKCVR